MILGILLAAGTSSRMGQAKQLLDWRGQPLVRHVAQQALASALDGLLVVVGYEAAAVGAALDGLPVQFVDNPAYAEGQASSLCAGLAALPAETDATVVLLCDQPLVSSDLINSVVEAFGEAEGRRQKVEGSKQEKIEELPPTTDHRPPTTDNYVAVIPRFEGQRGNPVLLGRTLFAELAHLRGDEGARGVLNRYREQVRWLDLNDPAVVTDIDTLEAYEALKQTKDERRKTKA